MDKELELLELIDQKLEELVFGFIDNFSTKVSKEIQTALLDFIDTLDNDLTISKRVERLASVNKFKFELEKVIAGGALVDGYKTLISDYKELAKVANEYFSLLSTNFEKELYRELFKNSISFLKESLTGAGITINVVGPIVNKLYQLNLTGSANKKELKAFIADYFKDNGRIQRSIEQLTTDSLYQMTSNYQLEVAKDLKIEYFYYAGTKIKTTRNFCSERYGKVYTKKEVESWADLTWSGKIQGTNKVSIFTYRGGWNCRHTLRPVSKTFYNNLKK